MIMRICRYINLITCAEKTVRILGVLKTAICFAAVSFALIEGFVIARKTLCK